MNKIRGAYISFDGGEGTGKTTQAALFKERYSEKVVTVREPGQSAVGAKIRELLLGSGNELTSTAELLLFSADRNLTYELLVQPALSSGQAVITDRSYLSTVAYQHYGRGLPRSRIDTAVSLALGDARPDKHVIFDMPYEQAFARMHAAGKAVTDDRFESEGRQFHDKVRNGYLEIARDLGKSALLVDASGTPEETYGQIDEAVGELIRDGVAA
jgi:dTMP kinase